MMYRFGFRNFRAELIASSEEREIPAYCAFVGEIRALFRELRTECQLLGPGLSLDGDGTGFAACLRGKPELDGITVRCAPAGVIRAPELQVKKIAEPDYLLRQYRLGEEIVKNSGFSQKPLLTGWKSGLSDRDALNDSSWAAANIIRTALTGYGTLPALPPECPLDILADGARNRTAFQGLEGLITIQQFQKPSFYALRFLKHLDEYFLYKDEHMIVSASYEDYFQIVIQNGCPLSYQYYLHSEQNAASAIPETFFESRDDFRTSICLAGVGEGKWLMKTRVVNETTGNVFHAWLSMNYPDASFMGRDELELLRAKSLPDISGSVLSSRDGVLEVPVTLAPNEIRHIHLIPIH